MKKYFLFLFLFLPYMVSAYTIPYTVYNYKTLNPIESANVTIYNDTYETSQLTNSIGYVLFDLNGSFNVAIHKSSYAEYDTTINITNNTENSDIYLTPYSHSGIVRIMFSDMTLYTHKNCFYFDNERLEGCYDSNKTIILHNNMVYEWVPIITKTDIISTPGQITKYGVMYFGMGIGLIALFMIIVFIIAVLIGLIIRF